MRRWRVVAPDDSPRNLKRLWHVYVSHAGRVLRIIAADEGKS